MHSYSANQLNPDKQQELNGVTNTISSISWLNNFVCCSSWDKCIYLWEVQNSRQVMKKETKFPILSTLFLNQGILFGDIVGNIRVFSNNQVMDVGKHDKSQTGSAITSLCFIPPKNALVSSSWNKKCCFWDMRQKKCAHTIPFSEKIYKCCTINNIIVALCSGNQNQVVLFDMRNTSKPQNVHSTGLNFPSRSLALSSQYYAVGSVAGRVAVKPTASNKNKEFTFKCAVEDKVHCFPVNDLCFHPNKPEFMGSAGSNGRYSVWDVNARRSVFKQRKRISCSINCCNFNQSGNKLAVAVSYDFSRGTSSSLFGNKTHHKILLHSF